VQAILEIKKSKKLLIYKIVVIKIKDYD